MANEEIITGLKNAVEHGESLQDAMQIMMNSGYNPKEVQEASSYVGGGSMYLQQPNPEENLVIPEQNPRASSTAFLKNQNPAQQQTAIQNQQQLMQRQMQRQLQRPQQIQQQPMQFQAQQTMQQPQQIQQQPMQVQQLPTIRQSSIPLAKQLEKIKPQKPSHTKEIILLIILLILIGTLISTIIFREKILGWFA